ncbi:macro domain-containing protein [Jeotgalibacillus haloalkalitolerans]|uniref:Macro domain-containing protein n=1 Tax=Jeotgalibacillus haloalkalitolerans TaxID=3104292 RepID=A0ABU5KJK3_9BACL|nr:macro domain-containing protein [Jeotgalibacillus sp. HH7-29]MDZ5711347.1 macro domain-containing protein [Jeotgalibacillus sp. HH7-29]
MSITLKNQSLLRAEEHIIGHQVNGLGFMGSGISMQIKKEFPDVFRGYQKYVNFHPSAESMLGHNLMIATNQMDINEFDRNSQYKIISNLFGQARIGRSEKQTNEKALKRALIHLKNFAEVNELSVALPYGIGCGKSGGDWREIEQIIQEVFSDYAVTLYQSDEIAEHSLKKNIKITQSIF